LKALVGRLLVFFVGFPVIIASVLLIPWYYHIGVCIIVIISSGLGAAELAGFFRNMSIDVKTPEAFIIGCIVPLTEYLSLLGILPGGSLIAVIVLLLIIFLTREIFASSEKRIETVLSRLTARVFVILYPGVLIQYIIRIASLPHASALLFIFFFMTFGNDSMAWASGMLFGKRRNLIPVSPNKSLAGFVGGFVISMGVGIVGALLYSPALPGALWKAGVFGASVGIATILGDLAESALKRSAKMKDSGQVIPGRGGMLDSVDSLVFAAPMFYYIYTILFMAL
jgi:phosphatidate cytidylyltransferase